MNFEDFARVNGEPFNIVSQQTVFSQGRQSSSLYIVNEGILRTTYVTPEGKEHIKSFVLAGDVIGSLSAIHGGGKCSFSLISCMPCKLTRLSIGDVYSASRKHLDIASAMIDILIAYGSKKERREYELLCLTAEERYRLMLKNAREIVDSVPQQQIALYLGITPVALSRIKKRIA
ncbi:MAG: Crp/Fnr family transcriptional regulator [Pseudomonadales bacterium]|nr:Crp/Fnr family transcriptional regulator [Pseudomonadales bacterium]MBL6816323.1 Crp/Fnr family transcriptional regulator [Pseudomonadales bacterium]